MPRQKPSSASYIAPVAGQLRWASSMPRNHGGRLSSHSPYLSADHVLRKLLLNRLVTSAAAAAAAAAMDMIPSPQWTLSLPVCFRTSCGSR